MFSAGGTRRHIIGWAHKKPFLKSLMPVGFARSIWRYEKIWLVRGGGVR